VGLPSLPRPGSVWGVKFEHPRMVAVHEPVAEQLRVERLQFEPLALVVCCRSAPMASLVASSSSSVPPSLVYFQTLSL
jgi:hypothetical protein